MRIAKTLLQHPYLATDFLYKIHHSQSKNLNERKVEGVSIWPFFPQHRIGSIESLEGTRFASMTWHNEFHLKYSGVAFDIPRSRENEEDGKHELTRA